jgi:transketolase
MRNAFAQEITALAAQDERVVLLSGDIGNKLFDDYKKKAPARFFNCGVAEANMVSVAAGMAMCGLRPVTYTINSFMTTRCFEQIRVDVCYHDMPVVIVGVGAGLSYASLGSTHHSCEDIAIMRALPRLTVMCPGDPLEVRLALRAALAHPGPVYIRIGKKGEVAVHQTAPDFKIGRGIVVREGKDLCLLSAGTTLPAALAAAEELGKAGLSARVVSFHTVKPLDEKMLSESFSRFRVVATVEEHTLLGGLGGAVAEWLADRPAQAAKLCRVGTPDAFFCEVGDEEFARERVGLTGPHLAQTILKRHPELTRK